jgi:hypothetical protein
MPELKKSSDPAKPIIGRVEITEERLNQTFFVASHPP